MCDFKEEEVVSESHMVDPRVDFEGKLIPYKMSFYNGHIKIINSPYYLKSFYFAESSRAVYSQRETMRLSSAWCE